MAGAEVLIYPTAIGYETLIRTKKKPDSARRVTIQRSHAVANGIPVISCNRVGYEQIRQVQLMEFNSGTSFIAGQQGEILAQISATEEENLLLI